MKTAWVPLSSQGAKTPKERTALKNAAQLLTAGGLVAFPTETVYGLGSNAFDAHAVAHIFAAKERPADNPLIVHVSDLSMLKKVVRKIPKDAQKLIDSFWPGPLTLILPKSKKIPSIVTAGFDSVAVRMPKNNIARELIRIAGVPIAAPSANSSTKPSPTKAKHVFEDLNGRIDVIIDGGACDVGLESTVLKLDGNTATILRPGAVTQEMIARVLPKLKVVYATGSVEAPLSPGMKYRHYAPKSQLILFDTADIAAVSIVAQKKKKKGERVGALLFSSTSVPKNAFSKVIRLTNPKKAAHWLFAAFRTFDESNVGVVYVENPKQSSGLWKAVSNRLSKASSTSYVK